MAGTVDVRLDEPRAELTPARAPVSPRRVRRYVALIIILGFLVTCGFAYRVAHKPGVYWSEVKVLFLAPKSERFPNALVTTGGDLASVAGTVARMVDPKQSSARVVSPDVTLVDQGVRNGYAVTLPNDGGQWADNFDKSLLDVQVAGPTAAEVNATTQRLVREINARLDSLQDQANVEPVNRITTSLNPSQPQIFYESGRRARALLATLAVGLGVTVAIAAAVRQRLRTRGVR